MNRPYTICHMTVSMDGKVTGDLLTHPACKQATDIYYQINRGYKADAFACGRVTMEHSFTGGCYPDLHQYPPVSHDSGLKMDYMVDTLTGFYAVAFDPKGKLGWKTNRITDEDPGYDGAQIIEVLTEQADPRYLGYLEAMEIPYLFAGKDELDVALALYKLKTIIGVNTLLLKGGSILNGAFQRENVIDEISLVMAPMVADANDKGLFMDGIARTFHLAGVKNYGGVLWLSYKKEAQARNTDRLYSLTFYASPNGVHRNSFPIGLFRTREEAEVVEARYRKEVKGFKDYPCEAEIREIPVMGNCDNSQKIYQFTGWNIDRYCEKADIGESNCFASRAQAEIALENAERETPRQMWALNCHTIGQCDWQDGFTRYGLLDTKNRCYTYFSIRGVFDPDTITEMLGLQPYKSSKIGDLSRSGVEFKAASWDFGYCDEYSPCVDEQIRKTIAPLLDKIEILNQIRQEYDVSFFLEVVPTIYAGDTNPTLPPSLDVIDFCHATRTEIDIDMYVMNATDD